MVLKETKKFCKYCEMHGGAVWMLLLLLIESVRDVCAQELNKRGHIPSQVFAREIPQCISDSALVVVIPKFLCLRFLLIFKSEGGGKKERLNGMFVRRFLATLMIFLIRARAISPSEMRLLQLFLWSWLNSFSSSHHSRWTKRGSTVEN